MINGFKKVFGNVTIRLTDKYIFVEGIPADTIERDIRKIWKTSKINEHMFHHIGTYSFSFCHWFAPEIVYALDKITEYRNRWTDIKTLNKIKDKLLTETWLANTSRTDFNRVDFSKLENMAYPPLHYQMDFLKYYDKAIDQYKLRGALLNGGVGVGKAQPLDAAIKVPGGWTTMDDVKIGDEVVCKDGTFSKITNIYPQGLKDIYKVTFKDGRTTECCIEHLWKVYRDQRPKIVNTQEIINYLNSSVSKKLYMYVDLIDAEEGTDVDVLIDPYFLGVYLGDGCSMSLNNQITITTPDEFIINEINKNLPKDYIFSIRLHLFKCASYALIKNKDFYHVNRFNEHKELFGKYNLLGKRSHEKFVPKDYLNGSRQQRLSLLQGLMDTDGTIGTQSSISYCSTSLQLAYDVQYLVRSLGGIANITTRLPHFTPSGELKEGRIAYQVNIRYKKQSEIFRLPKKKERTNDQNQYAKHLKLKITNVEYIGKKEAQCIQIDHPDHLYVTDNFIVTHNTYTGLSLSECLKSDIVVIIAPANSLDRVWRNNINTVFKTVPTHWISSEGKSYNGQKFLVLSYEYLTKFLDIIPKLKNGKVMVILDESHNLNELSAARSNLFLEVCLKLKATDILEASGTPVKMQGSELVPLFRAIDPFFTTEVEESFLKIFGKAANTALDMLNHRFGLVSFNIDKKELKLAEPIVETIKIKIPNGNEYTLDSISNDLRKYKDERMAYYATRKKSDTAFYLACIEHHKKSLKSNKDFNDLKMYQAYINVIKNTPVRMLYEVKIELDYCNRYEKNNIIPSLESHMRLGFKESKTLYKYTILKVQGECLGRILGRKRIDCHLDMIEYIDFKGICNSTTKKTLVFTSYVDVLEKTKKYLEKLDMNPLVVYGKTNSELTPIIKSFEANENLNPLVATFQSLSTAVPMIMADTMIMINAPFRDYIYTQTVGRINRLGADTQAYVYMISLDTGDAPNISNRSIDILQWSQEQVAKITGVQGNFEVNESFENYNVSISNETFDITEDIYDTKQYKVANRQFLNW